MLWRTNKHTATRVVCCRKTVFVSPKVLFNRFVKGGLFWQPLAVLTGKVLAPGTVASSYIPLELVGEWLERTINLP